MIPLIDVMFKTDPDFCRIRDTSRFKEMLNGAKERLGISAAAPA